MLALAAVFIAFVILAHPNAFAEVGMLVLAALLLFLGVRGLRMRAKVWFVVTNDGIRVPSRIDLSWADISRARLIATKSSVFFGFELAPEAQARLDARPIFRRINQRTGFPDLTWPIRPFDPTLETVLKEIEKRSAGKLELVAGKPSRSISLLDTFGP